MGRKLKGALFCVLVCLLMGCSHDKEKAAVKATIDLAQRRYPYALQTLLELPDRTLERDDSLFMLLSEAYYGLNLSETTIDAEAICDLDFSPDGKWVLFSDLSNGKVLFYSFPELRFSRVIDTHSPVYSIDFSADGSTFAAALSNSHIDIFDFNSGTPIKSLDGHSNRARAVAFLDSTHLVSGGNDQYVIFWDLPEGKVLDHQWRHRKNLKSLKRSLDGNFLLSTSNDGTAIIWDVSDKGYGKEVNKVVHGRNYVNDGAISPDNKLFVTVSGDGDAKVWDLRLGILKETIPLEDAGCSVEFSPDGKYAVVGGYYFVHIINLEKGIIEAKIPASNDSVWGIKFLEGNKIVFADSSHFYDVNLLSRKDLIKASRKWLKDHPIEPPRPIIKFKYPPQPRPNNN